jgi:hypothetical protein
MSCCGVIGLVSPQFMPPDQEFDPCCFTDGLADLEAFPYKENWFAAALEIGSNR